MAASRDLRRCTSNGLALLAIGLGAIAPAVANGQITQRYDSAGVYEITNADIQVPFRVMTASIVEARVVTASGKLGKLSMAARHLVAGHHTLTLSSVSARATKHAVLVLQAGVNGA